MADDLGCVSVTGGTGFVGSHLVRLLVARGSRVRVLIRPTSQLTVLQGLPVETITGDLRNPASLKPLVSGCSTLYHVAADYRLWTPDPNTLYESNVTGTENLLTAAKSAGVAKVVYTSTVGCLGITKCGVPSDEDTPVHPGDIIGHYKRSKFLAEQTALNYADDGLPVVIVNPSTPVGPGDIRPTPTGRIIVDFLNGRIPAFVDTGLNLIDVRDVAIGHILAAQKGQVGEKYILGTRNMSLAEILASIASNCHLPAPRTRIPHALALLIGAISTTWSDLVTHREPRVALESVQMSGKKMYFSADKAVRELGLPQSSVDAAIADAVTWFIEHGYVRGGGGI